ncbi:MAG: hypothetical protein IKB13_06770 [Clostridia bacterium]|nr:hypothetical protein [Clostridia bacterium]
MILPLNIFNFIESVLTFAGIALVVFVVICILIGIWIFSSDANKRKKGEEEKLRRENAIRNSEIYKKIFAYICLIVEENLREIPTQCNTQIPSQWLSYTSINFEEYKMTVCDFNRSDVAVRILEKNYCDFGYEILKYCDYTFWESKVYVSDMLKIDLQKQYPTLHVSSALTIDYRNECDKYSPYKK